jgi:hypothetical protein
MPNDPLKNKDRDEEHRRRREAGKGEGDPDGRAVAAALYGGEADALGEEDFDDSDELTLFD